MSNLVWTDRGAVRGIVDGDVRVFQGIPYAAPPRGRWRWRSPQPVAPWDGVLDATRPGDICPQLPDIRPGNRSEDCLNLKVTTATTPDHPRPVMVFLDAGGLTVSSNTNTDHRRLATEGDVVVVQPNERIGVFGFFAHPSMTDPAAGAFGVEDQQAALRWVRRNIAAFGGDPGNVTLFGVSGGGISTCANLLSPGAAGLFHRAIVQSGPFAADFASYVPGEPSTSFIRDLDRVRRRGAQLAQDLGCGAAEDVMARLRALPVSAFDEAMGADFGAIAHGNAVLPLAPADALRAGELNRVPLMMGSTSDEFTFYVNSLYPDGVDEPTYRALLDDGAGNADKAFSEYPPSRYDGSPAAALSAAQTDRHFALRTRQGLQAVSSHVPTFAFEFADRTAPLDPGYDLPAQEAVAVTYGAYHGADFQYVVDTEQYAATFDAEQSRLAGQVIDYWTTFARHGDPGSDRQPPWPRYDPHAAVPHVQRLRTSAAGGIDAVDFAAEHHTAFWDELYPAGS